MLAGAALVCGTTILLEARYACLCVRNERARSLSAAWTLAGERIDVGEVDASQIACRIKAIHAEGAAELSVDGKVAGGAYVDRGLGVTLVVTPQELEQHYRTRRPSLLCNW